MSPEELQGADLCSKIINVRKIEHRKNCELLKIANVAKINNMQNGQMSEMHKSYVLQNGKIAEMQRQKSCKCTKMDEMHSLLHARGVLKLQPLQN
jgi:hypothetical protein